MEAVGQLVQVDDLDVNAGELVAIIGHNGAGKTTLLKALMGLVDMTEGEVALQFGKWEPNPRKLISFGLAYVPQGNRVFPALTVKENLKVGAAGKALGNDLEVVLDMFPVLKERLKQIAGTLSGGERQMLALGRAMLLKPRLLLLDEPSLGLSPPVIKKALGMIQDFAHDGAMGVLIVEQKVREVLNVADRVYVLRRGQVVHHGDARELLHDEDKLRATYL
ncbi:MAG: ATP-binding cassette domain-containing protein [Pseudomonadota bacterium]|nr:ATP-binding cassette domain-containing protein [Pseudomonadota bacterium]